MKRRLLARLLAALTCSLALVIGSQPAAQARVGALSEPAGLHVSGNRLVDAGGAAIELHGVNISGTEFACAQGGTPGHAGWGISGGQPEDTAGTINAIGSWHVNAVRVPLNEDCWLGVNGIDSRYGGASYRAAIVMFVRDLRSSGMYVIVDLHWSSPGPARALSQQPSADEDHAPAFWRSVAGTFAPDPGVVFDLYNEPFLYASYMQSIHQDAWSCWLNGCLLNQFLTGGQPYTKSYVWQTAGMQQLLDVVRATGASNVVMANGLDWGNDDSGWLAHRPHDPTGNLVAGWHEYGGEACATLACWSSTITPITQSVPVVMGETGDNTGKGCSLKNLPAILPWADLHGVSYLAWTFNPWRETHDVLITDWQGTPSACEGQFYAAHLSDLALHPIAVESPPAPPLAATIGAQNSQAGAIRSARRVLLIATLMLGIVLVVLGVALATGAARIMAINAGNQLSNRQTVRFMQLHNVSIGLAMAVCGAILFFVAALSMA